MKDVLLENIVKRWEEVTDIPPQRVGPFTDLYKQITKRLKVFPVFPLILIGFMVAMVAYLLLGSSITHLVSILQRGF